jgi:hypothetical protein
MKMKMKMKMLLGWFYAKGMRLSRKEGHLLTRQPEKGKTGWRKERDFPLRVRKARDITLLGSLRARAGYDVVTCSESSSLF